MPAPSGAPALCARSRPRTHPVRARCAQDLRQPHRRGASGLHRGDAAGRVTEFGNVNVQTRVASRSAGQHVRRTETRRSGKTMTREEYDRIAKLQDDYIARAGDGRDRRLHRQRPRASARAPASRSSGPTRTSPACSRSCTSRATTAREPEVHVIYTPNLSAPGYPGRPLIAVDLEQRRHARHQLRLLRRVEEGRPADVEHDRLRPRRAGAARRPQGRSRRRAARRCS